jgi:hypothetical protein
VRKRKRLGSEFASTFAPNHTKNAVKKMSGKNKNLAEIFLLAQEKACKSNATWQDDQGKRGGFLRVSLACGENYFQARLRGI